MKQTDECHRPKKECCTNCSIQSSINKYLGENLNDLSLLKYILYCLAVHDNYDVSGERSGKLDVCRIFIVLSQLNLLLVKSLTPALPAEEYVRRGMEEGESLPIFWPL